jgi:hypothetical protein
MAAGHAMSLIELVHRRLNSLQRLPLLAEEYEEI